MRSEHRTCTDAELNRNALRAADNSTIQLLDRLWVAADTLSPSNSHCTLQDYDCNTKTDWHVKYYISVSTWQDMSDLRRWGNYFILFSHLLMPPLPTPGEFKCVGQLQRLQSFPLHADTPCRDEGNPHLRRICQQLPPPFLRCLPLEEVSRAEEDGHGRGVDVLSKGMF